MKNNFIVEDFKIRLDRYLATQLPEISRSQIQRDIEAGKAQVNGKVVIMTHFAVRKDDKILYHPSERQSEELQATNTPLKVLYNDNGLLIIDKPAGLTVHPGAGFKGETLASALLYFFKDIAIVGEEHRPGIVHRLDKDTSGVILVAKTPEMYEFLKDAFAERKIKKEYIALVAGKLEKPHGFIDTPIGRSKADFRKYTAKNPVEAKESLTEYKVLEYLPVPVIASPSASEGVAISPQGKIASSSVKALTLRNDKQGKDLDEYTLVMVKLHTGRTHQIRVHFSSLGHPLMGDQLYGSKKTQRADLHRQFLHAKKIEVQLPNKTWIEAESAFPEDLKNVLETLHSKKVNQL